MTTDRELLTSFLQGNHDAFRALTTRYVGLIYATARRQAPPHLAEDITQAVFLLLAQKAKTLRNPELLPAWLLKITKYCAANARRADQRRKHHEQKAAAMIPTIAAAPTDPDDPDTLTPHLDTALLSLSTPDRTALLLRYYNNNSIAQIAHALNLSEEAAKKRVSRALEKLRKFFAKKQIAAPLLAATLATTLAKQAAAAPASLAARCAAVALTHTAAPLAVRTIAQGARHMIAPHLFKPAAAILALLLITATALAILPRRPAALPIAAVPASAPAASRPAVSLTGEQNDQRLRNARDIATAIHEYASNRIDKFPADIGMLLRSIDRGPTLREKAAAFISPAEPVPPEMPDFPDRDWVNANSSYIYLGNEHITFKHIKDSTNTIIIYEKTNLSPDGLIAVAFLDAHAAFLNKDEAQKLIDASKKSLAAAADGPP